MYARVLKIHIGKEHIEEVTKLFEENVIPLCKQQKGYQGGLFLADRNNGQSIAVTFWKTKEDMLANERSRFFQEQVSKFISFFTAPPIREEYEVDFRDKL